MDKKTVKRGGGREGIQREKERERGIFLGGGRGLERMEGGGGWRVLPSFSRIGRRREQRGGGGGGGGGGIAIKSIWHNLR